MWTAVVLLLQIVIGVKCRMIMSLLDISERVDVLSKRADHYAEGGLARKDMGYDTAA